MVRVPESEDVSRILNYDVLEASTGPKARQTVLSGVPDGAERFLQILVRAARGHPDTRVLLKQVEVDILRPEPDSADLGTKVLRRMQYRGICRCMRRKLWIELT